jgi:tRNA(Arg) A34 adenosine deaminase TadA
MISASYKPKKGSCSWPSRKPNAPVIEGDYPIGAVITRLTGGREVVIASAGNRVKTSGSSIKHVELEMLKYVSSGYGRCLTSCFIHARTLCHVRRRLRVV